MDIYSLLKYYELKLVVFTRIVYLYTNLGEWTKKKTCFKNEIFGD